MNLLGRTWQIIRANARDRQQRRADNPERELEGALAELQRELACVRQAVAQAVATQKRTERQAQTAERQAAEWQQRARLALRKGDEASARAALARRHLALETTATLRQTLAQERGIVGKLKADLQTLESQASAATLKKDLFLARARSAAASGRLGALLADRQGRDSLLARVAERVSELEAAAELTGETTDGLEQRFRVLERSDRLDADLARLEGEIDR